MEKEKSLVLNENAKLVEKKRGGEEKSMKKKRYTKEFFLDLETLIILAWLVL